jgi:hypothetical protein
MAMMQQFLELRGLLNFEAGIFHPQSHDGRELNPTMTKIS